MFKAQKYEVLGGLTPAGDNDLVTSARLNIEAMESEVDADWSHLP